ncbi:Vacuolar protein sorting-associated protein 51 [Corchorus capsularis]|uniref:Vacuolar protein sorting-associated protein 51 n=1 Tax=Corchorus capsularis TaxID=210143 RepID=A0A1R3JP45_COCAP|nr:Vacuolar protein sorting-associated protein 51 [Corchorus capsularis]
MESSNSASVPRFRFRDHDRQEMEGAAHSDTSSGMSTTVSSDLDPEPELESMTGKGIKHLCSELLELKAESDEDFHRNIFSNYASFVRIIDEVEGMGNELKQLKGQVLTQKRLVKDLIDGIHLKLLSEETIDSILQESEFAEPTPLSKLEVHIENISETLEILMLENRMDEAIAILEIEDENLQRVQLEDNFPVDVVLSYNQVVSEKKAMLILQLTLSAENPRISAAELQKVLAGISRLGDSHLATQLLLKYYHSRIQTGIHNLQCSCSQSFLDSLYVKELAKFVFSMIFQAARSFVLLYGETSPYASELNQWAREETKVFVGSFNKYVNAHSNISSGLSTAVEAMQYAMSYCSLLKSQRLFLRPYLIKHLRPCMEEVLQIQIDHFKKVISMFTGTDTWLLGRYLMSGILSEGNYMIVGQQPEYCLLTNSGRKLVTLLQAIIADATPLLAIHMEGSILKGLMNLFTDYIAILEKTITFEAHISEKVSRTSVESLPQKICILANLSTLQHIFLNIIRSLFRGTGHISSELRKKKSIDFHQKELDDSILFIQEAAAQLRTHFCQQYINRIMSLETSSKLMQKTCTDNCEDPNTFHEAMPSVAFQVLFLELRKVDKLSEDNVFEEDWLMELLRELIEAIFSWIANNKEMWRSTNENLPVQLSDIISQFVLDMHFLVEIVKLEGYFSDNPLILRSLLDSAFTSAGLDSERDIDSYGWAKSAATEAILKLLEIEKMQPFSRDDSVDIIDEEPDKDQYEHGNDRIEGGSRSTMNLEDDSSTTDPVEVAIAMETVMKAESSPEGSLSFADVEDFSAAEDAVVLADSFSGLEDVECQSGISKAFDELHLQEKMDFSDISSSDGTANASEVRVDKKDVVHEADATGSIIND